jgi:hypothetical protein
MKPPSRNKARREMLARLAGELSPRRAVRCRVRARPWPGAVPWLEVTPGTGGPPLRVWYAAAGTARGFVTGAGQVIPAADMPAAAAAVAAAAGA